VETSLERNVFSPCQGRFEVLPKSLNLIRTPKDEALLPSVFAVRVRAQQSNLRMARVRIQLMRAPQSLTCPFYGGGWVI
jgi:hypothetical protein